MRDMATSRLSLSVSEMTDATVVLFDVAAIDEPPSLEFVAGDNLPMSKWGLPGSSTVMAVLLRQRVVVVFGKAADELARRFV